MLQSATMVDWLKSLLVPQYMTPNSMLMLVETLVRLLLAAVLGGMIGLEREVKHKPAGLRTQMFICFGSAFFTVLSTQLASEFSGDHTRIAAQIIPGIGFIGAGSILHSRGSVSGLTTAATLFVVASIGMACGGGLYLPAVFATLVILLALHLLGVLENRFSLKAVVLEYQVLGDSMEETVGVVNRVLDEEDQAMQRVQVSRADHTVRMHFTVEATPREHEDLKKQLVASPLLRSVEASAPSERE